MGRIKVEIEYVAQNPDSSINYGNTVFSESNNTSTNNIQGGFVNYRPFVIGASKFGQGQKFISRYNGFASRQCCDENGIFANPPTITINGTAIEDLKIQFSESLGQYATELKIDGQTYVNDSLLFVIGGLSGDSHTIQITKWSAPKFNARIDGITMGHTVVYDEKQVMELIAGNQNTADEGQPAYGLISQYGNLRIKDIQNQIKGFAEQQLLRGDLPAKVLFKEEYIGHFLSAEWSYKVNDVRVEFKDSMLAWQQMDYEGRTLTENETLLALLNEIQNKYNLTFYKEAGVDEHLQNIKIPYAYLERGTLWDVFDKICKAGQLRIWQDKDGRYYINQWK